MAAATADMVQPRKTGLARLSSLVSHGPLHVFLILVALAWLTPTLGLLVSSFRSAADYSESGWWTALTTPRQLTLEPYKELLANETIITALLNTVKIAVPASFLVVVVAAMAAYAFSWVDFRGRDVLFIVVVGLLVVPLQMALIPVARLFGNIGIFGTVWAAILFHIAFGLPFAIFLLRNFFIGIPGDLLEAARIDGASEIQIFRRIVLPLGMPAIASLLIFQFIWTWNDLLVALVFAGETTPLNVFIRQQMRTYGTSIEIIAPGAFISMIVPVIVFFAFQRYFVQGILAGSIK
ncbi:MAG TPA: carbohydrate ABC transporter permease [Actinomycetota bacterium]|jgi:ABC-type glycerol-3-phosphate transport system permease component|nr:carbohydrate ABC transporter permease [Actinomycetota bacterium]